MFNKIKNFTVLFVFVVIFQLLANANSALAASKLEGGNFVTVFNNTTQEGTWRDPITAQPSDVVEFRVRAKNVGDQVAKDVQVWGSVTGQVPQDPAMTLVLTGKINNPDEPSSLTDTATVNITGNVPVGMRYYPGHARINAATNKYNCPNTCDIPDAGVLGGLNVGDIKPGDFVEVTFKASLSALGSTPTPNPTVAPTAAPTATAAPVGQQQQQQQTQNNNQSVTIGNTNINVNAAPAAQPKVVTVASSQVKELPKTGLPLAGVALASVLPAGLKLKRFGQKEGDSLTANSIWMDREMHKD